MWKLNLLEENMEGVSTLEIRNTAQNAEMVREKSITS
jgi:hypothetical protein